MVHNASGGGPYRSDRECLEARIKKLEARNRLLWRALKIRFFQGFRRGFDKTRMMCALVILSSIISGGSGLLMLIFCEPHMTTTPADPTVHITPPLVVIGYEEDSLQLDIDTEELMLAHDRYPDLWDWDSPICARPFQIFDPELWIWIQCERRMCLGPLRSR